MSATDKRSNAYTIDNTSQGIFLSNCSLYQQIWTQYSVLRKKKLVLFFVKKKIENRQH